MGIVLLCSCTCILALLCGYALGVLSVVFGERIRVSAHAQRIAGLLSQRQKALDEKLKALREADLPMSTSEERRVQDQMAPELKSLLGLSEDENGDTGKTDRRAGKRV